ncbi:MAG TPA: hypothetical protein VMR31_08255 [Myxococcota bacterium]|nr:hypothetical protein [Myxococcota bacterium]
MSDELHRRGRALEEAFFAKQNELLLEKLRAQEAAARKKAELSEATGIREAALLDALAVDGVEPNALAALLLAPIVLMAWRKGKVESAERNAILRAAEARGVKPGTSQWALVESWLDHRPHPTLRPAWDAYVEALRAKLPPKEFALLRSDLVKRAQEVARAAGGILGSHSETQTEKEFIAQLEAALR